MALAPLRLTTGRRPTRGRHRAPRGSSPRLLLTPGGALPTLGSPAPPTAVRVVGATDSPTCSWLTKYPSREAGAVRRYERVKRATDVSVVLVMAPLWLPLIGLVALIIAAGSPGHPVFFKQHRTGRGLRRFVIYKFRTMVPNADELKAQLQHLNLRTWPDFKVDPDPRVTRLGRFLRCTSLDELPQLFNVLRGDMSLVGPRPTSLQPDSYEPWQLARFDGPSGLTGAWQVAGRAHPSFDQRVRLDLAYLERACWRLDAEILVRTVPELLLRKGA
jgi:lipopolysaccharide/colanic/teichoic acid biosynthesis glycosyltransferase